MAPETPFFASGALLLGAGIARTGGFPQDTLKAVLAVLALALIASATANTKAAPVVRAIGLLFLLASGMAAIRTFYDAAEKRKKAKK